MRCCDTKSHGSSRTALGGKEEVVPLRQKHDVLSDGVGLLAWVQRHRDRESQIRLKTGLGLD